MEAIQYALPFTGMPDIQISIVPKKVKSKVKDFSNRTLAAKIIQLGGGRQSSALVAMVVEGDLPRVDMAIFADTGDEPPWVYKNIGYLAEKLASVDIPLIVVAKNHIGLVEVAKRGKRFASMPIYTGYRGKQYGILRRQCTHEWKVAPAQNHIRGWLLERNHAFLRKDGARVVKRNVYVEQWYGFGTDEIRRQVNGPRWQKERYPLQEKGMNTEDALDYLLMKGWEIPKKSSCIVCPYHDDEFWLWLLTYHPIIFARACAFDEWLRSDESRLSKTLKGIRQECYLHKSCLPLREVDFAARIEVREEKRGVSKFQMELFREEITSGKCGTDGGFSCSS